MWSAGLRVRGRLVDTSWRPNTLAHPRVAVVVPRFQHSVVARNRVRRRLREILRRGLLAELPRVDLVVRARRAAYDAPVAVLRADLRDALEHVR